MEYATFDHSPPSKQINLYPGKGTYLGTFLKNSLSHIIHVEYASIFEKYEISSRLTFPDLILYCY